MSETTINVSEKKYELRKLQSKDVFPMFSIISKIGLNEFKSCFESDEVKAMIAKDKDVDTQAVGMKVVMDVATVVISHFSDAEDDIYRFLSGLSGMTKDEIKSLDMIVFFEMIVDVFRKDEFKDFIGVVSGLFK